MRWLVIVAVEYGFEDVQFVGLIEIDGYGLTFL